MFTAPPARITSRRAVKVRVAPSTIASTPVARVPSKTTFVTWTPVRTSRFGRFAAGLRYATAVLDRDPRSCDTTVWVNPFGCGRFARSTG